MRVPDYNDLLDAYQAEQDAQLKRRPKCSFCGEPIQDDYLFDIDEELYCEECMKALFRRDAENYEI